MILRSSLITAIILVGLFTAKSQQQNKPHDRSSTQVIDQVNYRVDQGSLSSLSELIDLPADVAIPCLESYLQYGQGGSDL